jgi:uncharacterized protein
MESAGVVLDEEDTANNPSSTTKPKTKSNSPENLSIDSLENMLNEALEKEDYERAAQLRDIIAKKKAE